MTENYGGSDVADFSISFYFIRFRSKYSQHSGVVHPIGWGIELHNHTEERIMLQPFERALLSLKPSVPFRKMHVSYCVGSPSLPKLQPTVLLLTDICGYIFNAFIYRRYSEAAPPPQGYATSPFRCSEVSKLALPSASGSFHISLSFRIMEICAFWQLIPAILHLFYVFAS
jgi:hypothetical protein